MVVLGNEQPAALGFPELRGRCMRVCVGAKRLTCCQGKTTAGVAVEAGYYGGDAADAELEDRVPDCSPFRRQSHTLLITAPLS